MNKAAIEICIKRNVVNIQTVTFLAVYVMALALTRYDVFETHRENLPNENPVEFYKFVHKQMTDLFNMPGLHKVRSDTEKVYRFMIEYPAFSTEGLTKDAKVKVIQMITWTGVKRFNKLFSALQDKVDLPKSKKKLIAFLSKCYG
jgi:hypothetical protein